MGSYSLPNYHQRKMLILEESLDSLECGTVKWNSDWQRLLGHSKSISSLSFPLSSKSMEAGLGLGLITPTLLTAAIFPSILLFYY